jgi:hypothetical protein
MNATKWVLIDRSKGANTQDGSALSLAVLAHVAEAVTMQMKNEFAAEWGAQATVRAGKNEQDIKPGEWVYGFEAVLPEAPGASAFHDLTTKGIPFALCAVTTCGSLYGPDGVGVDASHEILETAGDEGANLFANDNAGWLHAMEMCDAVELQTYGKTCADGKVVQVSNWLLRNWFMPGASGPYDYMTFAKLKGAVAPPKPLTTAQGHGGNYQIVSKAGPVKQVFGRGLENQEPPQPHFRGTRRKGPVPNWSSRTALRLRNMADME